MKKITDVIPVWFVVAYAAIAIAIIGGGGFVAYLVIAALQKYLGS